MISAGLQSYRREGPEASVFAEQAVLETDKHGHACLSESVCALEYGWRRIILITAAFRKEEPLI